jgi:hypothetical protein
MEALTIKGEIILQKNSTLGLMVLMCFNDQIMVSLKTFVIIMLHITWGSIVRNIT